MAASDNQKSTPRGSVLFPNRRAAVTFVILLPAAAAFVAMLRRYIVTALVFLSPICVLESIGLRCPLCGGTRCVLMLMRGQIGAALYYNPFVVAMLGALVWIYISALISCFSRPYLPRPSFTVKSAAIVLCAAAIIFLMVRNMPFYRAYLY